MAIDLNVEDQQLLAETFARARRGMQARERTAELLGAATFIAGAIGLWIVSRPHGVDVVSALVCTGVLALAALVRFETPFGFTVPTQLAFVPLVFSMPLALVPVATLVALTLASLPAVFRGRLPLSRLLACAGNARFALGPCFVFAAYDVTPAHAGALILVAALAAEFVFDFAG